MAVIQCPHCKEGVELEDGASGLFDCHFTLNVYSDTPFD